MSQLSDELFREIFGAPTGGHGTDILVAAGAAAATSAVALEVGKTYRFAATKDLAFCFSAAAADDATANDTPLAEGCSEVFNIPTGTAKLYVSAIRTGASDGVLHISRLYGDRV